jgi:hypothetical protein
MVQVFPPEVRFTGVSFSYNVACAAFGGITPLLVSWLAHLDRFSPAHYIAALGVVGVMTILMSRRTAAIQRELVSDAAA